MNLNQIHLIGRVTKEPEVKTTPVGTSVARLGVATNNNYKSKDGDKKQTTQFHNCVAFGRLAEIIGQYVKKGQEVYVSGRVEYRSWEKKDGGKAYVTEIMISDLQMGAQAKGFKSNDKVVDGEVVVEPPIPPITDDEIDPANLF